MAVTQKFPTPSNDVRGASFEEKAARTLRIQSLCHGESYDRHARNYWNESTAIHGHTIDLQIFAE